MFIAHFLAWQGNPRTTYAQDLEKVTSQKKKKKEKRNKKKKIHANSNDSLLPSATSGRIP